MRGQSSILPEQKYLAGTEIEDVLLHFRQRQTNDAGRGRRGGGRSSPPSCSELVSSAGAFSALWTQICAPICLSSFCSRTDVRPPAFWLPFVCVMSEGGERVVHFLHCGGFNRIPSGRRLIQECHFPLISQESQHLIFFSTAVRALLCSSSLLLS